MTAPERGSPPPCPIEKEAIEQEPNPHIEEEPERPGPLGAGKKRKKHRPGKGRVGRGDRTEDRDGPGTRRPTVPRGNTPARKTAPVGTGVSLPVPFGARTSTLSSTLVARGITKNHVLEAPLQNATPAPTLAPISTPTHSNFNNSNPSNSRTPASSPHSNFNNSSNTKTPTPSPYSNPVTPTPTPPPHSTSSNFNNSNSNQLHHLTPTPVTPPTPPHSTSSNSTNTNSTTSLQPR
nr:leucine-rich repeat extensin-like protein 5 [Penaeus vannamei]